MKSKFKYDYGNYKCEGVEYKVPDFDDLKANSAEWRNKISLLPVNAPGKVIGRYKYFSWNINKHIRKGEKTRRTTEIIRDLTVMLEESCMYENIVVNRRIKGKEFKYVKNQFEKNSVVKKDDFCSIYSKALFGKTLNFVNFGYLLILIPKGSKAVLIDKTFRYFLSWYFNFEREILLQKGSSFEFVKDSLFLENNKIFVVKLIENKDS